MDILHEAPTVAARYIDMLHGARIAAARYMDMLHEVLTVVARYVDMLRGASKVAMKYIDMLHAAPEAPAAAPTHTHTYTQTICTEIFLSPHTMRWKPDPEKCCLRYGLRRCKSNSLALQSDML